MIRKNDFGNMEILEAQSDERYLCYRPVEEFQIFRAEVDKEDVEMNHILIAVGQDLQKLTLIVSDYLEWLNNCEKELTEYMQEQLGESLPVNWMEEIEVYSVSVVFNNASDYGATISFGAESVAGNHIVELDFEKCEIVANRLNG